MTWPKYQGPIWPFTLVVIEQKFAVAIWVEADLFLLL
jgi:hypothetical protein